MKTHSDPKITKDTPFQGLACNGFLMIFVSILLFAAAVFFVYITDTYEPEVIGSAVYGILCTSAILLFIISPVLLIGLMILEPNQARAMVFFGKYRGTFSRTGFFWVNPFYSKKKVSLRARNINVEPIKVNDRNGNPILVGLILVWKVEDVYKAIFEIDTQNIAINKEGIMTALESFVRVQSDAALRQVAGNYAYDNLGIEQGDTITLRSGGDTINSELVEKLNERLEMAGISVLEARINYLAYAPEIAAVMLRRQQASAVVAAREKIVEGAVSMVRTALDKIEAEGIASLSAERKAAMVGNLLVVLCADEAAHPVVQAGSAEA